MEVPAPGTMQLWPPLGSLERAPPTLNLHRPPNRSLPTFARAGSVVQRAWGPFGAVEQHGRGALPYIMQLSPFSAPWRAPRRH